MKKEQIFIRRAPRDSQHPYMQLLRKVPQDLRLTLEQRGLLIYILSLPLTYLTNIVDMARKNGIGRDKARGIINRLKELGYCQAINVKDDHGRFQFVEYVFSEECAQVTNNQHPNPEPENQGVAHNEYEPGPENQFLDSSSWSSVNGTLGNLDDHIPYIDTTPLKSKDSTPPIPPTGEAAKAADVCSPQAKELTEEIVQVLKEVKPTCEIPKQKAKWHDASQKLIDRGIPKVDILKVLRWALGDNTKQGSWTGWASKIWAKKNKIEYLNEKFDSLHEQMLTKPQKRKFSPCSNDAKALEEWMACGVEIE